MSNRKLNPNPARQLTDREIAKCISGFVCSLIEWNDPKDVKTALEFVLSHWDQYVAVIENMLQDRLHRTCETDATG